MHVDGSLLPTGTTLTADVAIVGSGPGGIVTALELAEAGFEVVLLESGDFHHASDAQALGAAGLVDPRLHADLSMATNRQVGGASVIWGGKCVPYDPIDFRERELVPDGRWPVTYEDVVPYFDAACQWMVCGRPVFDVREIPSLPPRLAPALVEDDDVLTSTLERWSLPTNFGAEYGARLRESRKLMLVTRLTCVRIVAAADEAGVRADSLDCRTPAGGTVTVQAKRFVVAAGGLDSTRLLLNSPGPDGVALGDHSGHLGRWYQGHVEGVVANVHLSGPADETIYGYEQDEDGVYVRRRFTFPTEVLEKYNLPNLAAWFANPELSDARHGSGQLSFAYLALVSPLGRLVAPDAQRLSLTGHWVPGSPYGEAPRSPIRKHLRNLVRDWRSALGFAVSFGTKRFLVRGRRSPGFFAFSRQNVYPLQYHAEHLPHYDSRVYLSDSVDALGMRRLAVDVKFTDEDLDGIVRAHQLIDQYLQRSGAGRLEYKEDDVLEAVRSRTGAGFHQIGTTRMSSLAEDGVVDTDLRVHGVTNLHVVSSSAFVTSGQANSTFMIVAFAVRLAEHLAAVLHPVAEPTSDQTGAEPA